MGLIQSSMRYYRNVHTNVNLQYEYQIVMAQIREQAINCNGGIVFRRAGVTEEGAAGPNPFDTLFIAQDDPANPDNPILHIFRFDGTDTLLYSFNRHDIGELDTLEWLAINPREEPVTQRITQFQATINNTGFRIDVTMTFFNLNRVYTATQTIALRN
jgi:hypothetical protein